MANDTVKDFLNKIDDRKRREDAFAILNFMKSISKQEPKMWGTSIVGFGSSGDRAMIGFSPSKNKFSIYITPKFKGHVKLLNKLGKHKKIASCLIIKRLEDIAMPILKQLIERSYKEMKIKHKS